MKANPATSGITLRKMGEGDDGFEVHVFGIPSFSEDEIPRDAMAFVDVGVEAGVLHKGGGVQIEALHHGRVHGSDSRSL